MFNDFSEVARLDAELSIQERSWRKVLNEWKELAFRLRPAADAWMTQVLSMGDHPKASDTNYIYARVRAMLEYDLGLPDKDTSLKIRKDGRPIWPASRQSLEAKRMHNLKALAWTEMFMHFHIDPMEAAHAWHAHVKDMHERIERAFAENPDQPVKNVISKEDRALLKDMTHWMARFVAADNMSNEKVREMVNHRIEMLKKSVRFKEGTAEIIPESVPTWTFIENRHGRSVVKNKACRLDMMLVQ